MNTARKSVAGCGTQTAALAFGGWLPTTGATEEYDGSTWTTSPSSLSTARELLAGCRNTNSCFSFWWWCTITSFRYKATEEWTGAGVSTNSYNHSFLNH
jgi:hypothetical protein